MSACKASADAIMNIDFRNLLKSYLKVFVYMTLLLLVVAIIALVLIFVIRH